MQELIREQQAQVGGVPPSADRLAALLHGDERPARAELRRQIARLDLELAELFTSAFPKGGVECELAPTGGPRMLRIGELEEMRDGLPSRIADVRGILSDHAYVETRNRELLEQMMAEPDVPLGPDLQRGHRRARLPPLALPAPPRTDRDADGLVEGQGLIGLSIAGGPRPPSRTKTRMARSSGASAAAQRPASGARGAKAASPRPEAGGQDRRAAPGPLGLLSRWSSWRSSPHW